MNPYMYLQFKCIFSATETKDVGNFHLLLYKGCMFYKLMIFAYNKSFDSARKREFPISDNGLYPIELVISSQIKPTSLGLTRLQLIIHIP